MSSYYLDSAIADEPDRSCLIHREGLVVEIVGWIGKRAGGFAFGVGVVKDGNTRDSAPTRLVHKPSARDDVVIAACVLIHGDQERVRLPHMDVQVGVVLLHSVRSLGLHQQHVVVLNPEV